MKDNESVKAFVLSSVAFGQSCKSEDRVCANGVLGGSYDFPSCEIETPKSCLFNGTQVLKHGESATAYLNSTISFGSTCASEKRVCEDGTLSGGFRYASCTPGVPAACEFNTRTIAHGERVTAWVYSSVPFGSTCPDSAKQVRTCNNGVLTGNYAYPNCVSGSPVNWITDC